MGVDVAGTDVGRPVHARRDRHQPADDGRRLRDLRRPRRVLRAPPGDRILSSAGKVIADYPDKCKQLMPHAPSPTRSTTSSRGVQEPGGFGYNAGLGLDQPSAGKTGTIDGNRAVWFVGYTPNLATAAMLAGANSPGPLDHAQRPDRRRATTSTGRFGSTHAGPIWGDAMQAIEDFLPDVDFTRPDPTHHRGPARSTVPVVVRPEPAAAAATRCARPASCPSVGPYVDSRTPRARSPTPARAPARTSAPAHRDDLRLRRHAVPPPTQANKKAKRQRQRRRGTSRRRRQRRRHRQRRPATAAASRRDGVAVAQPELAAYLRGDRATVGTARTCGCSAPITLPMARMPVAGGAGRGDRGR